MSCARALSLAQLGRLRVQVCLASNFAMLEVAGRPRLWVAGALFREKLARLVGVIAGATTIAATALLVVATSVCGRR
jgi:hypothetical protein